MTFGAYLSAVLPYDVISPITNRMRNSHENEIFHFVFLHRAIFNQTIPEIPLKLSPTSLSPFIFLQTLSCFLIHNFEFFSFSKYSLFNSTQIFRATPEFSYEFSLFLSFQVCNTRKMNLLYTQCFLHYEMKFSLLLFFLFLFCFLSPTN